MIRPGTWCLAIATAAIAISGCAQVQAESPAPAPLQDVVAYVVDGDTVQLERLGRARLIGVDTPELRPRECGAITAKNTLREILDGRRVLVTVGREPRDRYGRALVRLTRAGHRRPIAHELVDRGLARVLAIAPNDEDAGELQALAGRARSAGRGFWSTCSAVGR